MALDVLNGEDKIEIGQCEGLDFEFTFGDKELYLGCT